MSEDLIVASTTDTEEQIREALNRGSEVQTEDPVLSEVDTTTGEPIEPAEEAEKVEEPAAEAKKDAAAGDADAKDDEKTEKTEKRERRSPGERRIAELTAQKYIQQRRAEQLEAEVEELRRSLDEIKAAKAAPADPPAETHVAQPEQDVEPQANQFPNYEEYIKALGAYTARKAATDLMAAQAKKAADAAAEEQQNAAYVRFQEGRAEAATRYADFEETMASEAALALPITPMIEYTIMTDPIGHDIAYYLAKNPHECEDIAKMSPPAQQFALGKLAAKLETSRPGQKKATPPKPKPVSAAPPPVEPVGRHMTSTSTVPDDELDYRAYAEKRNREEAERRARRR